MLLTNHGRRTHPDSSRTSPLPPPSLDEPPQRRVPDPAAPARKQLMDTGHLQAVGGELLVDLVRPGGEDLLGRDLHLSRARKTQPPPGGPADPHSEQDRPGPAPPPPPPRYTCGRTCSGLRGSSRSAESSAGKISFGQGRIYSLRRHSSHQL